MRWFNRLILALLVILAVAPAANANIVVQDEFNANTGRSCTNCWGTADTGGAYTITGTSTKFNVYSNEGEIKGSANDNLSAMLGVSTRDMDLKFSTYQFGSNPVGGNAWAYYEVRRSGSNNSYRFKVKYNSNNTVNIQTSRVVGGTETNLQTSVVVASATASGGVDVHAQLTGINPTRLQMKAWVWGASEPGSYQLDNTDSTGPQVTGTQGFRTYTDSGVTNAPIELKFDHLLVDDLGGSPPADQVIYAAGDIAGTGTLDNDTANVVSAGLTANPGAKVLTLGDNAYNDGTTAQYNNQYNPSWGAFKSVTYPTIGNHERNLGHSAADSCTYFGAALHCNSGSADGAAYYSFDLGNWHLIALNMDCTASSGNMCASGSAQNNWLVADLAANTKPCTLAFWHEPRWSGGHGSNSAYGPAWTALYNANADLILNGHDHYYQRFNRQTPAGVASSTGLQQIIVGTGGVGVDTGSVTSVANSAYLDQTSSGVLKLTLKSNSYDFAFQKVNGSNNDSGTVNCH